MIGSVFRTSFSSLVTIFADCAPERVVNILVPNDRPMVLGQVHGARKNFIRSCRIQAGLTVIQELVT